MTEFIIVAEVGSNHGGDMELAKRYIDESKQAGANTIKFQYYNVDDGFFSENDPRFGQVKKAQLNLEQLKELKTHCERADIGFLVTPFFSTRMVKNLATLGTQICKIREPDAMKNNNEMVRAALRLFDEVYVSTTRIPIDPYFLYNPHIKWMMATTKYPYPIEEFDLGMVTAFDGVSDHTQGITVPIAAAAVAKASGKELFVVEKHVTLDHQIPNLDQAVSIDFSELVELVKHLRTIERVK